MAMKTVKANRHGASVTLNHESSCASRFPLPIPLSETTSHSTRLHTTAAKSLVTPRAGEGENESLCDFHVNAERLEYVIKAKASYRADARAKTWEEKIESIARMRRAAAERKRHVA